MLESNDAIFKELSDNISNDVIVEDEFIYDFQLVFYFRPDVRHEKSISIICDLLNKFPFIEYRINDKEDIDVRFKYRLSFLMLNQLYSSIRKLNNNVYGDIGIFVQQGELYSFEVFVMHLMHCDRNMFHYLQEKHLYIKNRYDQTISAAYMILLNMFRSNTANQILSCSKLLRNQEFTQPIDVKFRIWSISPSDLKIFVKEQIDNFKKMNRIHRLYDSEPKTTFTIWHGTFIKYISSGEIRLLAKLRDRDTNEFVWISIFFENAAACATFINENLILKDANSYDFLKQFYEDLNVSKTNRIRRRIT